MERRKTVEKKEWRGENCRRIKIRMRKAAERF